MTRRALCIFLFACFAAAPAGLRAAQPVSGSGTHASPASAAKTSTPAISVAAADGFPAINIPAGQAQSQENASQAAAEDDTLRAMKDEMARSRARLETAIGKYFDGGVDANVVFSHEGVFYRADCSAHLDSGAILTAQGEDKDAYRAFDVALEHLEKQVRRYMRKLKSHHP